MHILEYMHKYDTYIHTYKFTHMSKGFFEKVDNEQDEVDDFSEAAAELQYTHNTYFGMVTKTDVARKFKGNADEKW